MFQNMYVWHTHLGNGWDDYHVPICSIYILNIQYSVLKYSTTLVVENSCQLYLNRVTLLGRNTLEENTGSGCRNLSKSVTLLEYN